MLFEHKVFQSIHDYPKMNWRKAITSSVRNMFHKVGLYLPEENCLRDLFSSDTCLTKAVTNTEIHITLTPFFLSVSKNLHCLHRPS